MSGKIAVVTGATRGLGRGIARALGTKGYMVVVTGRNSEALEGVVAEIGVLGGRAVSMVCDHGDDASVEALIRRVDKELGRLDLLVNNATFVNAMEITKPGGFWEKPLNLADMIVVGLRSNYTAAYYAAPLMIRTGTSLIANISFYGAVSYHYGPAYGAAKAGTDKMTFDMAVDLKPHGVAAISIWPGLILTDMLKSIPKEHLPPQVVADLPNFETPEFTGLVLDALLNTPDLMTRSGQTFIGAALGREFNIRDTDGKQPRLYTDQLGRPEGRFLLPA